MERGELAKLSAHSIVRLSHPAQLALLDSARLGKELPQRVREELAELEHGAAFLQAFAGGMGMGALMDTLAYCDQSAVDRLLTDRELREAFLRSSELPGHRVVENEAVYHSLDLEVALSWFQRVLGWQGFLEAWDENGRGAYGLVLPQMAAAAPGARVRYVQLMQGEPCVGQVAVFAKVWAVRALRESILARGWEQVSPVARTDWGADLFTVTTADGVLLQFYEPGRIGL